MLLEALEWGCFRDKTCLEKAPAGLFAPHPPVKYWGTLHPAEKLQQELASHRNTKQEKHKG